MKICVISKYPPIEGGVSSRDYWLVRALGERGHKLFIVTNSWAIEDECKEHITKEDFGLLEPKNVSLFSFGKNKKSIHILNTDQDVSRLTGLAINVVRKYDPDIIYSHYLLPYGIAALFLKKLVGKPLVVRHAGSDLNRLYNIPSLETMFSEVFSNADSIIGYNNTKRVLINKGVSTNNLKYIGSQIPDLNYFNPKVKPCDLSQFGINEDVPVFSYFGKISPMKQTYNFINALSKLKKESYKALFVVGNGQDVQELKRYTNTKGVLDKCVFIPFQPPWKIPSIMRASTCVIAPENYEIGLPINIHFPHIASEAAACGKCSLVGYGVSQKGYYKYMGDCEHLLIVRPEDVKDFSKKLSWVIKNLSAVEDIGTNAYRHYASIYEKNRFIEGLENLFTSHIS